MPLFAKSKLLVKKQTLYHQVEITEEEGVRYLRFGNRVVQGAVLSDDPFALHLDYTRYLPIGLAFLPECRNMLCVGLGAGSVPKLIARHCPDIRLTAVEIDSELLEIAKQYLHLGYPADAGFDIVVSDARVFLRRQRAVFDIIILDAYSANGIPYHLTTLEFLSQARARLSPDGLITANLWSTDWNLFLSMVKTYSLVFSRLYRFEVPERKNVIIVAGDSSVSPKVLRANAAAVQAKRKFPYDFPRLLEQLDPKPLNIENAPALKDAEAPLEWLARKKR